EDQVVVVVEFVLRCGRMVDDAGTVAGKLGPLTVDALLDAEPSAVVQHADEGADDVERAHARAFRGEFGPGTVHALLDAEQSAFVQDTYAIELEPERTQVAAGGDEIGPRAADPV